MTVQEVVKDCGWKRGCVAEWAGVVPTTMVAHCTTEILQALHRFVSEVQCTVPQPAPGDPSRLTRMCISFIQDIRRANSIRISRTGVVSLGNETSTSEAMVGEP